VEAQVVWNGFGKTSANLSVKIAVFPQEQPSDRTEAVATLPVVTPVLLPAPKEKGFTSSKRSFWKTERCAPFTDLASGFAI